MNAFGLQQLPFRLHDFTRSSWVNEQARSVWLPRMERVAACWLQLEMLSVVTGMRSCAHSMIPAQHLEPLKQKMAERGLAVEIMEGLGNFQSPYAAITPVDKAPDKPANYSIVVGSAEDTTHFHHAWDQRDQTELGRLLGYPVCCTEFFNTVWYGEKLIDISWPMAYNSLGQAVDAINEFTCTVPEAPYANVMLRWLGIRAVPHLPCRFDCPETIHHAEQFIALGRNAGYVEEMDWLMEMLCWPMEWSALHGIAEIKTPVVKVVTTTDATPVKYTVQYQGTHYPEAGARGLAFPYAVPSHLKISESNSFQRGISNPIQFYDHD